MLAVVLGTCEKTQKLQQSKTTMFQARNKPMPPLQPTPQTKPHSMAQKHLHPKPNTPHNKLRLQMQKQNLPKHKRNLPLSQSRNLQPQILPIRHRHHNKNRPPLLPKPPNHRPNQTNPNKPTQTPTNKPLRNYTS